MLPRHPSLLVPPPGRRAALPPAQRGARGQACPLKKQPLCDPYTSFPCRLLGDYTWTIASDCVAAMTVCVSYLGHAYEIFDVRKSDGEGLFNVSSLISDFVDPKLEMPEHELVQADGTTKLVPGGVIRSFPSTILYGKEGLACFDKITKISDQYYLTNCEKAILNQHQAEIAAFVDDGYVIVELGCGSMEKTSILLNGIAASGKTGIKFYALDIEPEYLKSSIGNLLDHDRTTHSTRSIDYFGILGSYQDSIEFLSNLPGPKLFLWLGSSIGNYSRDDAAALLRQFAERAMEPGDLFLCGIDQCNDARAVALAYNDTHGTLARERASEGARKTETATATDNETDRQRDRQTET